MIIFLSVTSLCAPAVGPRAAAVCMYVIFFLGLFPFELVSILQFCAEIAKGIT